MGYRHISDMNKGFQEISRICFAIFGVIQSHPRLEFFISFIRATAAFSFTGRIKMEFVIPSLI